eukprot:5120569-Prymnesium_polylepis.1
MPSFRVSAVRPNQCSEGRSRSLSFSQSSHMWGTLNTDTLKPLATAPWATAWRTLRSPVDDEQHIARLESRCTSGLLRRLERAELAPREAHGRAAPLLARISSFGLDMAHLDKRGSIGLCWARGMLLDTQPTSSGPSDPPLLRLG